MKKFLRPLSPFRWYKKGSCQLLAKECALTILVNCLGGLPGNSVDRLTVRARNDLKSRKTPTLQQNTFKGLGSRTCRIGPVNRDNIKVAQQKCHRTFLCAEHFYFHEQHLFSCVNPLLLCYRVLNMGRVSIFLTFSFGGSFLRLWLKIWQGAHPPYKMKFWQGCEFIILYKTLWDWFYKHAVPLLKIWKIRNFSRSKMFRPNHRGRHLGKINGHKSIYIKVWRCTFWWITIFF